MIFIKRADESVRIKIIEKQFGVAAAGRHAVNGIFSHEKQILLSRRNLLDLQIPGIGNDGLLGRVVAACGSGFLPDRILRKCGLICGSLFLHGLQAVISPAPKIDDLQQFFVAHVLFRQEEGGAVFGKCNPFSVVCFRRGDHGECFFRKEGRLFIRLPQFFHPRLFTVRQRTGVVVSAQSAGVDLYEIVFDLLFVHGFHPLLHGADCRHDGGRAQGGQCGSQDQRSFPVHPQSERVF